MKRVRFKGKFTKHYAANWHGSVFEKFFQKYSERIADFEKVGGAVYLVGEASDDLDSLTKIFFGQTTKENRSFHPDNIEIVTTLDFIKERLRKINER